MNIEFFNKFTEPGYRSKKIALTLLSLIFCFAIFAEPHSRSSVVRGTVKNSKGNALDYVTVSIKDTRMGTTSDEDGNYVLRVIPGKHTLTAHLIGYAAIEKEIEVKAGEKVVTDLVLEPDGFELEKVEVVGQSVVQQINKSAYNVIAIDTKGMQNSTLDLAHAMAKVSGVKIRESGGLGSDLQFSLNGYTGKHVKFFMDGVPMEGMGSSFQINNIPINLAERIEIYKGVVPIGFGADAIGGAINIVTNQRRRTYVDASYSYGSFNTHRTSINAGYTTKQGIKFEINAFQNYSDNTYKINTPVKDLVTGGTDRDKVEKVKRFHDTYHNETVIAKVGLVDKSFADRLVIGVNLGKNYKEIQNGVRQEIVYGEKFTKGHTFMPSLQYMKREFFTDGLSVNLTANYNRNITQNIDTSTFEYNWRGEKEYMRGAIGEQKYQNSKYENKNWNMTFTSRYILNDSHSFTLNDVFTSFDRNTRASASDASVVATDTMPKVSRKNVLGADYKFSYDDRWNVSVFGKHYLQYSKGPKDISTSSTSSQYEIFSETFSALGYGMAATYFWKDFQIKASYEKAYRLPTYNELFGDEDLEHGSTALKAENSDNYNLSISYTTSINKIHFIYVDAGFMLRNTKDYIRRVIDDYSNIYWAAYTNHGYVKNLSFNGEIRYGYKNIVSAGLNVTSQNIRDYEDQAIGTTKSLTYKARLPNTPYFFANGDIEIFWNNFVKKKNNLSFGYYTNYVREFPLYWEVLGDASTKKRVPNQFSHDLSITYAIENGRYNISVECKNITDEKLYDNFSLQKPGRAFYAKIRYFFSK